MGAYLRIGDEVFIQCVVDAGIDNHLITLLAFFFSNGEAFLGIAILIHKLPDAQLEEIRNAQGRIDPDHEQQEIAVALGPFELMFDLGEFFLVPNRFDCYFSNYLS